MDANTNHDASRDTDPEVDRDVPTYLDMAKLQEAGPRSHAWALEDWLRMGTTTPMLGESDAYKSIFVQQLATVLASGCDHFVSDIPQQLRVLAWMCEDIDELRRRQLKICEHLEIPAGSLAGRLFLASTADTVDCAFLAKVQGRLVPTPTLRRLREKIGDLQIGVVMLNVAKTLAGNEHERHNVMAYLAALEWARKPTNAAILLVDDPPKPAYKAAAAISLENAVPTRLWFSARLPGESEDPLETPDLRYLYKRKANYTSDDLCVLCFDGGAYNVVVPPSASSVSTDSSRRERQERCKRLVRDAVRHFEMTKAIPAFGDSSTYFLPKLIIKSRMAQGFSKAELTNAMLELVNLDCVLKVDNGEKAKRLRRSNILVSADASPQLARAQVHTLPTRARI